MTKKEAAEKPRAYTAEEGRDIILKTIANYVDYWDNVTRRQTSREKLEGLAFSIMVILDGGAGMLPGFIVRPNPCESDKDWNIKHGQNYWDSETDIAGCLHEHIHEFLKK